MRFIVCFGRNYLLEIISDWISLAHFCDYLTKNATYGIARNVSFDLDMALRVKISNNWGLGKHLSRLSKNSSSIEN